MKRVRCAVYTRKSSEEGLEQDFNSLHAQREACDAYIKSQASEGWTLVPNRYDDGGLSGGSLDRSALKALLADIAARRIDIVVVYKVDRLTRSLIDFSKLVEAFDGAGVSFVSVTQAFNTTTSMGRLTLNMLLSFAQFEREVTAERIRDKIAQSKARGMWMGGVPPLGYEPDGRTLKIVPAHAAIVQRVFGHYLELGTVRQVEQRLVREGISTPPRISAHTGRSYGGRSLTRGQIYKLLANPIYVGEIAHGEQRFAGQHAAIIDRATWDAVQAQLAGNAHAHRSRVNASDPSLLAGVIVDEADQPLVATHATKRGIRYRYYVSRDLQHGTRASGASGIRIPAAEIEPLVIEQIAGLLADPIALCDRLATPMKADCTVRVLDAGLTAAERLRAGNAFDLVRAAVSRIVIRADGISIKLRPGALLTAVGITATNDDRQPIVLNVSTTLTRCGRVQRLVLEGDRPAIKRAPDTTIIKALQRAHCWWAKLGKQPDLTPEALARNEGVSPSYLNRILRLTFLDPAIVHTILSGEQCASLDLGALTIRQPLPLLWSERRSALHV